MAEEHFLPSETLPITISVESPPPSAKGRLEGVVTDNMGVGVAATRIEGRGPNDFVVYGDSSGYWFVEPLDPGHYVVTITATGYESGTTEADVVTGTVATANISLTRVGPPPVLALPGLGYGDVLCMVIGPTEAQVYYPTFTDFPHMIVIQSIKRAFSSGSQTDAWIKSTLGMALGARPFIGNLSSFAAAFGCTYVGSPSGGDDAAAQNWALISKHLSCPAYSYWNESQQRCVSVRGKLEGIVSDRDTGLAIPAVVKGAGPTNFTVYGDASGHWITGPLDPSPPPSPPPLPVSGQFVIKYQVRQLQASMTSFALRRIVSIDGVVSEKVIANTTPGSSVGYWDGEETFWGRNIDFLKLTFDPPWVPAWGWYGVVWVNGQLVAQQQPGTEALWTVYPNTGRYAIRITAVGYQEASIEADVVLEKTTNANVSLSPSTNLWVGDNRTTGFRWDGAYFSYVKTYAPANRKVGPIRVYCDTKQPYGLVRTAIYSNRVDSNGRDWPDKILAYSDAIPLVYAWNRPPLPELIFPVRTKIWQAFQFEKSNYCIYNTSGVPGSLPEDLCVAYQLNDFARGFPETAAPIRCYGDARSMSIMTELDGGPAPPPPPPPPPALVKQDAFPAYAPLGAVELWTMRHDDRDVSYIVSWDWGHMFNAYAVGIGLFRGRVPERAAPGVQDLSNQYPTGCTFPHPQVIASVNRLILLGGNDYFKEDYAAMYRDQIEPFVGRPYIGPAPLIPAGIPKVLTTTTLLPEINQPLGNVEFVAVLDAPTSVYGALGNYVHTLVVWPLKKAYGLGIRDVLRILYGIIPARRTSLYSNNRERFVAAQGLANYLENPADSFWSEIEPYV